MITLYLNNGLSVTFTFQSGYIQIQPISRQQILVNTFTFQSGYIQILLCLRLQTRYLISLHSTLVSNIRYISKFQHAHRIFSQRLRHILSIKPNVMVSSTKIEYIFLFVLSSLFPHVSHIN